MPVTADKYCEIECITVDLSSGYAPEKQKVVMRIDRTCVQIDIWGVKEYIQMALYHSDLQLLAEISKQIRVGRKSDEE